MNIREAVVEDSRAIGHLQLVSWHTMFTDSGMAVDAYLAQFSDDGQAEDWRDLLVSVNRPLVYVAETSQGQVIGFASSTRTEPGAPYASELVVIHILPGFRRQGVGRQLISTSARKLRQSGCSSMWLWTLKNNPARAVYEHLGGTLAGEKSCEVDKNGIVIEFSEVAYAWPTIETLF